MENETESKAIQAAAKAAKSKALELPTEIRLRNGVLLGIRPMPPLLLNSVANSIPEPEVPVFFNDEKGRDEENPNHPNYVKALEERNREINLATINLILYACTYIKEIPEGVEKPTDEGWHRLARMAGIDFNPEEEAECYLTWLRCMVETGNDLLKLQTLPLQLAGVTEEEVDDLMESFRSGEERGADNPVPTEVGGTNGNHVQEPSARSRAGNRRA